MPTIVPVSHGPGAASGDPIIETQVGNLPASLLVRTERLVDTPDALRRRVEYRLREHPAITFLKRLQFSVVVRGAAGQEWRTCIECTGARGDGHTAGCSLARLILQSDADTSDPVRVEECVEFLKVNPFEAQPIPDEIDIMVDIDPVTSRGTPKREKTANLVRTTRVADLPDRFECHVEYRYPGQSAIVQNDVHVMAKTSPFMTGSSVGHVRTSGANPL